MYHYKVFIVFIIFLFTSCTEIVQNRGMSVTKINEIKIDVGLTSKQSLNSNYGPPIFESIFNKNTIYYVSHTSTYKTFKDRKTRDLVVLEIMLDDNDIVKKVTKYNENDALKVNVSNEKSLEKRESNRFWKDILNNLRKRNVD